MDAPRRPSGGSPSRRCSKATRRRRSVQGSGVQAGDKARVSAGKVKLTILPLSTGVRDNLIEAAVQELVDGLDADRPLHRGDGRSRSGVALAQQGIKPEEALEGKGLGAGGPALQDREHPRRPLQAGRGQAVYGRASLRAAADGCARSPRPFFVPPSIRPTTQGSRFSQGGPANPPQAKQRSLLRAAPGRELEAGSTRAGRTAFR